VPWSRSASGADRTRKHRRHVDQLGEEFMAKAYALMLGIVIGSHALIGWFIEGYLMLGLFNVDIVNDIVYTVCAVALLLVGATPAPVKAIQAVLLVVGLVFVLLGIGSMMDERLGGLLPTGTTILDHVLLLGTGAGALLFGVLPWARKPLMTNGTALN
jgi:hypothetical protein